MNLRTWTLSEAHRETGIPVKTLRQMVDRGDIAGNRSGKLYRVSVASLEAWVYRRSQPAAPTLTARAFPEVADKFS